MNITIINGSDHNPDSVPYEKALLAAASKLEKEHNVSVFTIRDMNFHYCTGCWDCWTKTPGICMHKDDGVEYQKSLAHTDALLFFSPVVCGFLSSETKKALDRFIPSALPYIRIHEEECHHVARYQDPKHMGIFLFDDSPDPEAVSLIKEYSDRLQKNMKAGKKWFGLVKPETMEVTLNEIMHS